MRVGIIPARAGFTADIRWGGSHHRDHPRSRGVYHVISTLRPYLAGSSPLARGLLIRFPRIQGQSGIIPARAGFTDAQLVSDLEA